jgi:hypothetical protein
MNTPFAEALLAPGAAVPQGWVAHNGSDPLPRFNVYRNNVVVSLMQALRDTFPVLADVVDDAVFDAWAHGYLLAHPPSSPVLTLYGEHFADFISPLIDAKQPWLSDLARLEIARIQVFHAEDVPPIDSAELMALTHMPELLENTRLALGPAVQVVRSSGPVFDIWATPSHTDNHAQSVLVTRELWEPVVILIDEATAVFIEALQGDLPLGQAIEHASEHNPAFDLVQALALLIRQQCISHITLPDHHFKDTP